MGQYSAIEWTDHTFNPWWGCIKVSSGCAHCYAETWANRYGHDVWGLGKPRRFFSDNHWQQPVKWNRDAEINGRRARVFCASMADVFEDNRQLDGERERLWELIESTPMLDWLLLTKRPENMNILTPWELEWPPNVWAMVTVEDQNAAETRIPHLLNIPALVKGLSVEPMLGPVALNKWITDIQWVIAGGESGPKSRPMNPEWVRALRDLCIESGVAFFFKQWGNWVPAREGLGSPSGIMHARTRLRESPRMKRVSKKRAGNELDGIKWTQLPNLYLSIR